MSGTVGRSGCVGCQLYCKMPSRHRTNDGHYYPVMNCPRDYAVDGCCHPDISDKNLETFQENLPGKYKANLQCLMGVSTHADYKTLHLALGICKPTLFSGLPCQLLPVPSLFIMDIMHLNNPDLFIKLLTGKLDVYEPDDRAEWGWAIFYHRPKLWSVHGETAPNLVLFIPSSFGCAP